ncbi:SWIM zinc finger family protein [Urbifossiella limnaea]|uniref:SWIM zinc finger protein n=1 Tax=Urbifossiella limnaea TaxID=2528023 RepID=A0A517Y3H1_9BACT|nr:SWIM zinc finger family protein [Urbifossiella limnaea]QDU24214.1 SWIM zinc finger protein [Urbifossiella limnaea]
MWYGEFFPKSKPRAVAGGIKAQSKAGAFGTTWWAKKWIGVLESFNIGARLGRGRSYARQGQVTDIGIAPGKVTAKVQGSRPQPYAVVIEIEKLAATDWDKLVGELNTQAAFAAKLLAGEMPQDIETAFARVGLSLFPSSLKEIKTDCSCPDWSNPCKHIAAVYYLIGEEFDRDPFLLFRLRGTDRETICGRLSAGPGPNAAEAAPPAPPEPVPSDAATFWASGPLPAELYGDVRLPPVDAAGPKRLGGFPFWRGTDRFLDTLVPTYSAAARRGLTVFEAESMPPAADPPEEKRGARRPQ